LKRVILRPGFASEGAAQRFGAVLLFQTASMGGEKMPNSKAQVYNGYISEGEMEILVSMLRERDCSFPRGNAQSGLFFAGQIACVKGAKYEP
jgi:hypothetical protein